MHKSAVLGAKAEIEMVETGIASVDRRKLADGLAVLLADTYSLYLKTLGFHWNVVGPLFYGLHKLTEAQYEELAQAIDRIAERIRALGYPAPAGFGRFVELRTIKDASGAPTAEAMIQQLIADHEHSARALRALAAQAADAQDDVTVDLATARLDKHEQAVWMLRALVS